MLVSFHVASAIALDLLMIAFTLWVLSLNQKRKMPWGLGTGLLIWLCILHLGISHRLLFSSDISGVGFLAIIFGGVGIVGAALFSIAPVRTRLLALTQEQLLLLQGIRVFFGAGFLMQAAQGQIPLMFGIIDGWTHITAGFLGLAAAFTVSKNLYGNSRILFANIFGLADILVVASSIALILLPELTPHHTMMYAVFLPAPLWFWFHIISLWKLNIQSPFANA